MNTINTSAKGYYERARDVHIVVVETEIPYAFVSDPNCASGNHIRL